MFSKIRKHFNIVVVFGIIYIILLLVLFIGKKSFFNSVNEDKELIINCDAKYVENLIDELVDESSKNILLFEKNLIEKQTSTTYVVMESVFEEINEKGPVVELANILLYSKEAEYYNYQNQGIDDSFNVNDLAWVGEITDYYDTQISYFYDENLGENYMVVSEKIMFNDMVIAMCYKSEDISKYAMKKEKGSCYLMGADGKIVVSNEKYSIGKDAFEKNKVLEANKSILKEGKNQTNYVSIGKNNYYVTVEGMISDHYYVSIIDNYGALEEAKAWYYKSIILDILIMIVVALGFIKAYFSTDQVNNIVESKCQLVEKISDEIKKNLSVLVENAKYFMLESTDETFIRKANLMVDVTNTIEYTLDTIDTFAKMNRSDYENEKGEYIADELMKEVEGLVSNEAKKHNIYLDIDVQTDERLKFYGADKQIKAAIVNLLNYSIGKTYQGGVEVIVTSDEIFADKTKFVIKVKDTSSGMEDTEVSELQELLNNKRKNINIEDIGLGIDMVKVVLNNIKGSIEITSTKNVGTEYVMKLPVVALFNNDENFIREKREQREKEEDKKLNDSFWEGIDKKKTANTDENNITDNSVSQNLGVQNMGMQEMRQENLGMQNIGMEEMGQENLGMQNISMEEMGQENLRMQNMGIEEMGQENLGMQNMGMEEMGQENLEMQNISMEEMGQENLGVQNIGTQEMEQDKEPLNSISIDEMNKKYIDMMNSGTNFYTENKKEEENLYYQTDTINSMGINTLYVDEEEKIDEEDIVSKEKRDKMYIYLQEDSINVDSGLENCSNDVYEYEKILKEFYSISHKNVRNIIGLWNQKKHEEYYIEITKFTTNALNIGAYNLYNMLCEQQKNYNSGDMKQVAANVKVIFDEWKKVLLYIAEYFKN